MSPNLHRGFRQAAADDAAMLADAQRHLAFTLLAPACIPAGYRLAAAETVPHGDDLVTLVYQDEHEKSFRLSQRKRWLPLREELQLARVPNTAIRCGSVQLFVVHGVYVGEPIDHSYSARHRRSVATEIGGLVCELHEVMGQGPGLCSLIALARSLAPQIGVGDSFWRSGSPVGGALLPSSGVS